MSKSNLTQLESRLSGILVSLLVLFFCVSGIPGCGGGSAGTGFKRYEGTVTTESGRPIAGVLVTIVDVNGQVAQAYTNSDGRFAIEVDTGDNTEVPVQFTGTGIHATAVLSDVPVDLDGEVTVKADFQIADTGTSAVGGITSIVVNSSNGSTSSSTGTGISSSSTALSSSLASSSSSSSSHASSNSPPSSSSQSSSSSQGSSSSVGGGGGGPGGPTCPPTCVAG